MEFMLAKVYVKFYLVQINSAESYYDYLKTQSDNDIILKALDDCHEFKDDTKEDEIDIKYKKFFLYKEKIFSKVEIMGLIIEKKPFGIEAQKLRYIIYLDDGTSIIQCICWNNKNPNVYNDIKQNLKAGDFVIIYGYFDNYQGYEILIDNFKHVNSPKEEMNYHISLQRGQKDIFSYKPFPMLIDDIAIDDVKDINNKTAYTKSTYEFANLLLAYFQNFFEMKNEREIFVSHSFIALFEDESFNKLIEKYCNGNGIKLENKEQFLVDCINLLDKQCLGSYTNNAGEKYMDLNISTSSVVNKILSMFTDDIIEIHFNDIYNKIHNDSGKFYNGQYIKFILNLIIEKNLLMYDASKNLYSKQIY